MFLCHSELYEQNFHLCWNNFSDNSKLFGSCILSCHEIYFPLKFINKYELIADSVLDQELHVRKTELAAHITKNWNWEQDGRSQAVQYDSGC